nr:DUF3368 domain-containing protein [Archaeoglobus neptunius]
MSWIFEELEGEKVIPKTVYSEVVVKGKERGEVDAFIVEKLVKKGAFRIIEAEPIDWLKGVKEIHTGEIEALSLARKKGGIAVIDDSIAREIGEILDVNVHGTLYLIFLMMKKGKLDRRNAIDKVDMMIRNGFRLSVEVYSEFLRLLGYED